MPSRVPRLLSGVMGTGPRRFQYLACEPFCLLRCQSLQFNSLDRFNSHYRHLAFKVFHRYSSHQFGSGDLCLIITWGAVLRC